MGAMTTPRPIKPRHLLFLTELLKDPDRNGGKAYARVYQIDPNSPNAGKCAHRLLIRPDVAAELARLEAAAAEKRGITSEEVVREITMIAKADPRGMFEVWRGACRYCHGANHFYHRTPREYREAWAQHMAAKGSSDPHGLTFDHQGGVGFNQKARPHDECPECFGLGEVYEIIKDSRDWTPGAARLFSGLQRTKEGLKLTTRSQDHALKLAAQLHHLLVEKEGDDDKEVPPAATVTYAAKDGRKK